MTDMLRRMAILAVALCTLLLGDVAAFGDNVDNSNRGRLILKVTNLPDPRADTPESRASRAVLRAFKEKFPHIEPAQYSGIEIEGQSMDSKPLLAIAGGVAPDVLYVNFRLSHTYISMGLLYPMDEYLLADMGVTAEDIAGDNVPETLKDRVPGPAWPVIRRKGDDDKLHVWALPDTVLVRALVYRKDLFERVGLDPDQPPRDWDELEQYAKQMTRPEEGTFGLAFLQGQQASWDWIAFLWSMGGDAVALNENEEWEAVFDSDAAAESLLYFVELHTKPWLDSLGNRQRGYCFTDPDRKRLTQLWAEAKIGMRIQYLDEKSIGRGMDPEAYGIAPVPLSPIGQRGSELNCTMLGLFAEIKGRDGYTADEVRRAAWDYIRFMDGDEARRIRTRVMVESGQGKFFNPLYLKKYGYDEYVELVPDTWLSTFEEAYKNGHPEPYGKNCQMVFHFMTYPMEEVMDLSEKGELGGTRAEKLAKVKAILKKNVERTNVEMIGKLTDQERSRRNSWALVVGLLIFAAFIWVLTRVWKTFTPPEAKLQGGWGFKRYATAYIILIPALASILLWKYIPMGMGSLMVFQDYRIVGESKWTGLDNLADVLFDPVWWQSLARTLYYMFIFLTIGFASPIILAILLTEVSRFKVLYRTLYYLPAVLSGMLFIYLWKLMFHPAPTGLLNQVLALVGLGPLKWIKDPDLAMLCCVLPSVWAGAGPKCLLYLAALKTVPDDLYEAADLDGSGFFSKIRHITLPTLKGLIIINFIGEFIMASQNSKFILVMTFGGPNDVTKVAGLHIFQKAYLFLRFGTATTMAWMLGVVMLVFTTIQLKRLSRMEFTTADRAAANR